MVSMFSMQAFSQQINYRDSLAQYNSGKENMRPRLNYSVVSSFTVIPHLGTVTGFAIASFISVPLSPKLSVDGGIIAGRYYSTLRNFGPESSVNGIFNEISLFGSASYHISSQLTVYGIGIKQLTGTSSFNLLPKSSYTIGSTFNFGSFSIGAAVQMSGSNDISSPLPIQRSRGFYSPFGW